MRAGTTRAIGIGAIIALGVPGEAAEAPAQRTSEPAADRMAIVRLVAAVRRADYEGDRAGLRRLHHELAVAADGALGARIAYWRGFALWRRAFNGFNDGVERGDLERDLVEAVREFDQAAAHDPTLVDARIGSISCLQSLAFLYQQDAAKVAPVASRFVALLREAQTAAPDNPRLQWVYGASQWYAPRARLHRRSPGDKPLRSPPMNAACCSRASSKPARPIHLIPHWGELIPHGASRSF